MSGIRVHPAHNSSAELGRVDGAIVLPKLERPEAALAAALQRTRRKLAHDLEVLFETHDAAACPFCQEAARAAALVREELARTRPQRLAIALARGSE